LAVVLLPLKAKVVAVVVVLRLVGEEVVLLEVTVLQKLVVEGHLEAKELMDQAEYLVLVAELEEIGFSLVC